MKKRLSPGTMYLKGIAEEILRYCEKLKRSEKLTASEILHFELLSSELKRLAPESYVLSELELLILDLKLTHPELKQLHLYFGRERWPT